MTAVAERLRAIIRAEGPISVARFMSESVGAYYASRDPLGRQGDFTTAPEISQVFGELIGLWCAAVWDAIGRPQPARLVEFGPGRGTLMADALRAIAQAAPEFGRALDLHLVETSPALRARQAETLGAAAAHWHEHWRSLPPGPVLAISNEFVDALPVHQLIRRAGAWHERLVGLSAPGEPFRFETSRAASPLTGLLPEAIRRQEHRLPEGSIVEMRPAAGAFAADLAARIAESGGAALIIDYGHGESGAGDTLQAVRGHRPADPLADAGEADLTVQVDFAALAEAAARAGAAVHGPIAQGLFLRGLGIEARTAALLRHATPEQGALLESGSRRLISPTEMGRLFKVLALSRPEAGTPPGFEGQG